MTARLDPDRRRATLERLGADDLDVLVVGGGLVGAGVALDAVSRGLRVGLVERGDWGSGDSGRTSTLVNGRWRDVSVPDPIALRQALAERGMLTGWLAPHVVRRAPFLYPLVGGPTQRLAVGAQVLFYDGVAQSATIGRSLPAHRHLTGRAVRRLAPALPGGAVTGGVQFYDAQADDARLVITVVRTASAYGGLVAHHAEAVGLMSADGRVGGARVRDHGTGAELEVKARVVVLATGRAGAPLLDPGATSAAADVEQAAYVVVPRAAVRSSTGIMVPTTAGMIRIVPWGRHWLVGPVVTAAAGPVSRADLAQLLDLVNPHLGAPLDVAQITGCYTGPVDASPLAPPTTPRPGLVRAGAARLATYRIAAARTGDTVARELGGLVAPSVTVRLPLLGADGYHARWNQRHLLARRAGLHVARVEHLLNRYGAAADDLLQLITTDPELGRPLSGAEDYLRVEIVYAVSHEDATQLTDLLSRRTRVMINTVDGGAAAAAHAAALAAPLLGWDAAESARQVDAYHDWLASERAALSRPAA